MTLAPGTFYTTRNGAVVLLTELHQLVSGAHVLDGYLGLYAETGEPGFWHAPRGNVSPVDGVTCGSDLIGEMA